MVLTSARQPVSLTGRSCASCAVPAAFRPVLRLAADRVHY
jgi:hypothetical protein